MLFILLCSFALQAHAVVLEKGDASIGQLTVPEIEDKLQVMKHQSFSADIPIYANPNDLRYHC